MSVYHFAHGHFKISRSEEFHFGDLSSQSYIWHVSVAYLMPSVVYIWYAISGISSISNMPHPPLIPHPNYSPYCSLPPYPIPLTPPATPKVLWDFWVSHNVHIHEDKIVKNTFKANNSQNINRKTGFTLRVTKYLGQLSKTELPLTSDLYYCKVVWIFGAQQHSIQRHI